MNKIGTKLVRVKRELTNHVSTADRNADIVGLILTIYSWMIEISTSL